jgi:hypothetical protein
MLWLKRELWLTSEERGTGGLDGGESSPDSTLSIFALAAKTEPEGIVSKTFSWGWFRD